MSLFKSFSKKQKPLRSKSLSPLVTTLLIVLVVILLAGIFISWSRFYIRERQDASSNLMVGINKKIGNLYKPSKKDAHALVLPPVFIPNSIDNPFFDPIDLNIYHPFADVYYTLDGSTPTLKSTPFTSLITFDSTTTVKAIAYSKEHGYSDVVEGVFEILNLPKASNPSFSLPSGGYPSSTSLTLSCSTPSNTIRYTINNSTPSRTQGSVYSSPLSLTNDVNINAVCYSDTTSRSDVVTKQYIIFSQASNPSFSLTNGGYPLSTSLTLSCSTPNSTIRYTLDNSTPTRTKGSVYFSPLTLISDVNINAVCYSDTTSDSNVVVGEYTILPKASSPTFSLIDGDYIFSTSLTLECSTPNSTIKYTTDNSTPSRTHGNIYSSPFTLTSDVNIGAICYSATTSDSNVIIKQYTVIPPILALSSTNGRTTIKNNTDSSITFVSYNLTGFDHNAPLDSNVTIPSNSTENIDHGIILENFSLKLVSSTGELYLLENLNQTVLQPLICPTGYIPVPGNYLYDTMNDSNGFCVAKWEMKNVSGSAVSQSASTPWVNTIQSNIVTICTNIGPGYHLISNNEWMTIVRNIELNPSNWSENEIGSGYIPRGNHTGSTFLDGTNAGSGESKRTLTLTNGEIIWDLAGNANEWTADQITEKNQPDGFKKSGGTSDAGWHEFTPFGDLDLYLKWNDLGDTTLRYKHLYLLTSGNYNATNNGIGTIYTISNSTSSIIRVVIRGGGRTNTTNAGVIYTYMNYDDNLLYANGGFRCGFSGSALPKASNPTFSLISGGYPTSTSLSLSCSTPNSKIRYTTDNSTPSRTLGNVYSSPLTLTTDTNISAICFSDTTSESDVVTQQYIILQAPILALSSINGRTTIKNNTDSSITFVSYNLAGFDHNAPLDSVLTLAGGATGNIDHGIILENFSLKLVTNTDDLYILENLNQIVLQPSTCATGYIPVPGNYLYNTMNDSNGFCVAKWEMKNVSDNAVSQSNLTPWIGISQSDAKIACNNIGSGYHLISNNEWMTIVRNIELVSSNWSGNEIGNGYIPRGNHNTSAALKGTIVGTGVSKRTLTLTNGEIIWDLAGNVYECTDNEITEKDQPDGFKKSGGVSGTGWHEYTIFGDLSIYLKWNDLGNRFGGTTLKYKDLYLLTSADYNAAYNGIGYIFSYSGSNSSSLYVFNRGGDYLSQNCTGLLSLDLSKNASSAYANYGFRCAYS